MGVLILGFVLSYMSTAGSVRLGQVLIPRHDSVLSGEMYNKGAPDKPLKRWEIVLCTSLSGECRTKTHTDDRGIYRFKELTPHATYWLVATSGAPDYKPCYHLAPDLPPGEETLFPFVFDADCK